MRESAWYIHVHVTLPKSLLSIFPPSDSVNKTSQGHSDESNSNAEK